ncbi:MAG: RteC domain-containing protein [Flavobacteriales bacterium]
MVIEIDDQIKLSEIIIKHTLKILSEIRDYVLEKEFINQQEEIHFFKELKPKILSKLIYYNSIYRIETKKPNEDKKNTRKFYKKELDKIKLYFDNNLEFYKYYRTGSTYLDEHYFVRGKHNIKLSLDTFCFEADHRFTTSHDYKVAKIIANDLIQVYIEDKLNSTNQKRNFEKFPLSWTGSKTALIELIYALHVQGVFDNGNTDIKVIAKTFESIFNINLGDFYHTFMELKARKINRTKFLDSLRDALIRKMDEQDEM